jgi:intracellular septation protein
MPGHVPGNHVLKCCNEKGVDGRDKPGHVESGKAMSEKKQLNPILKLTLDIGPLVLFFAVNAKLGIFAATAAFMVAVLIALAVSYAMTRHIAIMPVVTAVIVLVFGGLTLVLHDELFIKLKPTIIYVLFGGTLLGGLAFDKPFLSILFDQMFHLTDEGWRKLTWRWSLFFFALAIANEIVWRTQSTDFWVSFKLFGVVPLTFLFGALQMPLINKYSVERKP